MQTFINVMSISWEFGLEIYVSCINILKYQKKISEFKNLSSYFVNRKGKAFTVTAKQAILY